MSGFQFILNQKIFVSYIHDMYIHDMYIHDMYIHDMYIHDMYNLHIRVIHSDQLSASNWALSIEINRMYADPYIFLNDFHVNCLVEHTSLLQRQIVPLDFDLRYFALLF
jgi:hypothetical protein